MRKRHYLHAPFREEARVYSSPENLMVWVFAIIACFGLGAAAVVGYVAGV